MSGTSAFILNCFLFLVCVGVSHAQLSPSFYQVRCNSAVNTIWTYVYNAVRNDNSVATALLRLHFHDCFVNGCDASILLDDTPTFTGEKTATQNAKIRGFEVVDAIKAQVESVCPGVVSCADILALATQQAVSLLGGQSWQVQLGRRDSTSASLTAANRDLPAPTMNIDQLIFLFSNKGFNPKEMVALSGGHTIGVARCVNFRDRLYGDPNINVGLQLILKANCPQVGGDDNVAPLETFNRTFDTNYFSELTRQRGLLKTDQVLYTDSQTDTYVSAYATGSANFRQDFANAMVKMGNLSPLTGSSGQIRTNCRRIN